MGIIKAAKLAFDYLRYDEDGNVEATQRAVDGVDLDLSLIHISEPTRLRYVSRMPSSA